MLILNLLWSLILTLVAGDVPQTPADPLSQVHADAVALEQGGEEGLAALLAQYDSLPEGAERERASDRIDALAGQRYAAWARLYWYRDLEAAKEQARKLSKPILSLRMLGRLDEDLSCANSRFFRVVLYANQDVSAFLRDNFVLHWSSERPVPKVTIDMGDGRRIETTLAGNSAHYVLDSDGRAIDVLPGLYSPAAFVRALSEVLPLATLSPRLSDADRLSFVREHFARSAEAAALAWSTAPMSAADLPAGGGPAIATAERLTISKREVEKPIVDALSNLSLPSDAPIAVRRVFDARLDANSQRLLAHLQPLDWMHDREPLPPRGIEALVRTFESAIARDTQVNELVLRPQARAVFFRDGALSSLAAINERIYAEVFKTPATDPWLGLSNPLVFSALPRDGLVSR
jgi:hypothetical protein